MDAIDERMAEFNKATGYEWTAEEQAQQTRLAKQLNMLDFARKYPQDETSRLIHDSSYGYALFAELKVRHQSQVQTLARYEQERVKLHAKAWRETSYDRDDAWSAPCDQLILASDPSWIHPLDDRYNVVIAVPDLNQCDVAISDQCRDRTDAELFMQDGQVLGYWNTCDRCHAWLAGMARAEKEPDDDPERKAKHAREVEVMYGNATRNLTPLMRPAGKPDPKVV